MDSNTDLRCLTSIQNFNLFQDKEFRKQSRVFKNLYLFGCRLHQTLLNIICSPGWRIEFITNLYFYSCMWITISTKNEILQKKNWEMLGSLLRKCKTWFILHSTVFLIVKYDLKVRYVYIYGLRRNHLRVFLLDYFGTLRSFCKRSLINEDIFQYFSFSVHEYKIRLTLKFA